MKNIKKLLLKYSLSHPEEVERARAELEIEDLDWFEWLKGKEREDRQRYLCRLISGRASGLKRELTLSEVKK